MLHKVSVDAHFPAPVFVTVPAAKARSTHLVSLFAELAQQSYAVVAESPKKSTTSHKLAREALAASTCFCNAAMSARGNKFRFSATIFMYYTII